MSLNVIHLIKMEIKNYWCYFWFMNNNHGGKRSNAGRKRGKTFTEPSKMVSFRIPESAFQALKAKYGKGLSEIIREFLLSKIDD